MDGRRNCDGSLRTLVRGAVGGMARSVSGLGYGATVTTVVALVGGVCRGGDIAGSRLHSLAVVLGPFTPRMARRI